MTADTDTSLELETDGVYRIGAEDRCDRCGAQAHVIIGFTGGILGFCAFHARRNWAAISDKIVASNLDDDLFAKKS